MSTWVRHRAGYDLSVDEGSVESDGVHRPERADKQGRSYSAQFVRVEFRRYGTARWRLWEVELSGLLIRADGSEGSTSCHEVWPWLDDDVPSYVAEFVRRQAPTGAVLTEVEYEDDE